METSRGPIFIGGSGRSGTTILGVTLGLHPNIFAFPDETRFLVDPRGGLIDWMLEPESARLARAFRQRVGASLSARDVVREALGSPWRRYPRESLRRLVDGGFYRRPLADGREVGLIRAVEREHFRAMVKALLANFPANGIARRREQVRSFVEGMAEPAVRGAGAKRWCDSTPHNVFYVRELSRIFPEMRFIHMIRDGRDVAYSFARRGWTRSKYEGLREWHRRVAIGRRLGASLPRDRYIEIVFEKLIAEPEATLRRVVKLLGEEWHPSLDRHPICSERANRHLIQPDADFQAEFEALAGPWCKEMGWARAISGGRPR